MRPLSFPISFPEIQTRPPALFRGRKTTATPALEIHPLERQTSDAIVKAVRLYSQTYTHSTHPDKQRLETEFVDAIHRMQQAFPAIRFYHTLNEEYRLKQPQPGAPMTSEQKLKELTRWTRTFKQQTLPHLTPKQRPILDSLLQAWEHTL